MSLTWNATDTRVQINEGSFNCLFNLDHWVLISLMHETRLGTVLGTNNTWNANVCSVESHLCWWIFGSRFKFWRGAFNRDIHNVITNCSAKSQSLVLHFFLRVTATRWASLLETGHHYLISFDDKFDVLVKYDSHAAQSQKFKRLIGRISIHDPEIWSFIKLDKL